MDANDASSPGSLSSPPHSPEGTPTSTVQVSSAGVGVGPANVSTPTHANATSPTPRGLTVSGQPRKSQVRSQRRKTQALQNQKRKLGNLASLQNPKTLVQLLCARGEPKLPWKRRLRNQYMSSMRNQLYKIRPHRNQSPLNQYWHHHSQTTPLRYRRLLEVLNNQEPSLYSNPNLSHMNVVPSTPGRPAQDSDMILFVAASWRTNRKFRQARHSLSLHR